VNVPPLVLASASPRRRQLLEQIGLTFDVEPAEMDETALSGETAADHVLRLAIAKARVVAAKHREALVIGGDTVVVLDREILAKPRDHDEAVDMLMRLQGRTHLVATGTAVVAPGGEIASEVVSVDVRFRPFDVDQARDYVATGEPLDKAGAYGIQGYGAVLVEAISGDYFAVMGLPIAVVVRLLEDLGWRFGFGRGLIR